MPASADHQFYWLLTHGLINAPGSHFDASLVLRVGSYATRDDTLAYLTLRDFNGHFVLATPYVMRRRPDVWSSTMLPIIRPEVPLRQVVIVTLILLRRQLRP